ncbi:flagellar filament capping protein FliD [Sphingomonas sp.]|uniref:flagellar filament capping protein FliD n=1 Tax=Sphingomonas sp. TaxID=28214 RepID=UPI003B3AC537
MTSIANSLGVGSGIDIPTMVNGLVSATYDPKIAAQTAKETANSAKISTLATLRNSLSTFSTALNTLVGGGTLKTQPTSSDSSVATVALRSGASIGAMSAQIEVRQLAQPQSIVSAHVASSTAAIGKGTMTLSVGGSPKTITIDDGNNSLAGLARAINAAGAGVTATVVTDANGARLALKGGSGSANAFTLTADAGADPALATFTYGDGGDEMTLAQAAQDAILRRDGIDMARPSNTIDDLIEGVTLTLTGAKPGTNVTIGSRRPTEAITQAVTDFVDAYNEIKAQISAATSAGSGGGAAGALYGHGTIKTMERQLAQLVSTTLQSGAGPQTLAEIGVSTRRDGTLAVDASKLAAALKDHPDSVEAMFNPQQRASSPLVTISSPMGATKPGTYTLTNLVAATGGGNASGTIDGRPGLPASDGRLYASSATAARGLIVTPMGNVASVTITVDAGLGGALQGISDAMTRSDGLLGALGTQFDGDKKRLSEARDRLEAAQTAYKDQLTANFTRMESRVAASRATQSYLTQQIAMWTRQN